MGDVIGVDFRGRVRRSSEMDDDESLKNDFLSWLRVSEAHRELRAITHSVDTRDVETCVAQINSAPEENPTGVLLKNLMSRRVNEQTAPNMLASIKVLRNRFGIS